MRERSQALAMLHDGIRIAPCDFYGSIFLDIPVQLDRLLLGRTRPGTPRGISYRLSLEPAQLSLPQSVSGIG